MTGLYFALTFAGSFLFGILIARVLWGGKTGHGTLRIDTSNPEKDLYRIDLDNLDKIATLNRIVLTVDPNADLSH